VHSRRKYPKEGKSVLTARGEEKVVANDIFRERVTVRAVDGGDVRTIALSDLLGEMSAAGDLLAATLAAAARETVAAPSRPIEVEESEGEVFAEEAPVVPTRRESRPAAKADKDVDAPAPGSERRVQRRRGRRGGRRNRPGGAPGDANTGGDGSVPGGA